MPAYRSRTSTHGRTWLAPAACGAPIGMKESDWRFSIVAVVNLFTQFVPGQCPSEVDLGQLVVCEIEAAGGIAKEMNIAIDDGIAMGHDG